MARKKTNIGMEEMLKEVEQVIENLQSGNLKFEENLEQYQKAVELLKECSLKLEKAEKELIILEVDEL
ncbi:exodeoxyribonuclease VII small subunit [Clostridiales bacterium COT073_COT-073]|nr:exodeoxyribonuclease VII small subunit [Clostridiales bacterium COT073_COT-073]